MVHHGGFVVMLSDDADGESSPDKVHTKKLGPKNMINFITSDSQIFNRMGNVGP